MRTDDELILRTRQQIDWTGPISQALSAAIVAAIILGANLPFYFMLRSDMKNLENKTDQRLEAIQQEMKDFHNEMKDLHHTLILIEERNKSK